MKENCEVIRDLLPLVQDGVASEASCPDGAGAFGGVRSMPDLLYFGAGKNAG